MKTLPKEPTKNMILAGEDVLDSCLDSDFDSGPDGEAAYHYNTIKSGTASRVWIAMVEAWEKE